MIVTFLDVCVWVELYNIGLADLGFGFGLITALDGFGLVCRLWFPDFWWLAWDLVEIVVSDFPGGFWRIWWFGVCVLGLVMLFISVLRIVFSCCLCYAGGFLVF